MKTKLILGIFALLAAATLLSYSMLFSVPPHPQLTTMTPQGVTQTVSCYQQDSPQAIDANGHLNVLVWNLYKQNRDNWRSALDHFSAGRQLVLLQEASMDDALKAWIDQGDWNGNQVEAFKAFESTAGVLNLASELPQKACAYTELEPWIRLPKSGLYATYALSNGETLAVVNIHAVNFTYGTQEYQHQLAKLVAALQKHQGPMIIAGDFNSWSQARLQTIREALSGLGLQEAAYQPDHRRRFINGLPLDHLFYRGLNLNAAQSPATDASDHNPLLLEFRLQTAPSS